MFIRHFSIIMETITSNCYWFMLFCCLNFGLISARNQREKVARKYWRCFVNFVFWKSRNKVCEKYVSSPFDLSNHRKYVTYRSYKRFNQQGKIVTWNLAQDEFHPDSDNGFDGIISIGLYIFHHGEQNSIHNSRKNFWIITSILE